MKKIRSIEALKEWNENPTKELPIVAEWFYDWIFEECLIFGDYDKFRDAYETMVRFDEICNDHDNIEAKIFINNNLKFWRNRASYDIEPFKTHFNRLVVEYFGV